MNLLEASNKQTIAQKCLTSSTKLSHIFVPQMHSRLQYGNNWHFPIDLSHENNTLSSKVTKEMIPVKTYQMRGEIFTPQKAIHFIFLFVFRFPLSARGQHVSSRYSLPQVRKAYMREDTHQKRYFFNRISLAGTCNSCRYLDTCFFLVRSKSQITKNVNVPVRQSHIIYILQDMF